MLRALIAASPPPNRHALSREFCRRIGWLKPDGGLKNMMARVTMLAIALMESNQRATSARAMSATRIAPKNGKT